MSRPHDALWDYLRGDPMPLDQLCRELALMRRNARVVVDGETVDGCDVKELPANDAGVRQAVNELIAAGRLKVEEGKLNTIYIPPAKPVEKPKQMALFQ